MQVEEADERGRRVRRGGKRNHRGTPQGGVISPLLASIYMHRFLRAWRERGMGDTLQARLVNYADDFGALDARGIDGFVAVGREGKPPPELVSKLPRTRAMLDKLRTKRGRQRYRRRQCVVEPPFGWIKSLLGMAEFSLRGLAQVRAEWHLVCAALNLRRVASRMAWR